MQRQLIEATLVEEDGALDQGQQRAILRSRIAGIECMTLDTFGRLPLERPEASVELVAAIGTVIEGLKPSYGAFVDVGVQAAGFPLATSDLIRALGGGGSIYFKVSINEVNLIRLYVDSPALCAAVAAPLSVAVVPAVSSPPAILSTPSYAPVASVSQSVSGPLS